MLISKGEIVKDGQDPLASKWNLAQKQYSNNPLLGRLGSNAYSSTRTEVISLTPQPISLLVGKI